MLNTQSLFFHVRIQFRCLTQIVSKDCVFWSRTHAARVIVSGKSCLQTLPRDALFGG